MRRPWIKIEVATPDKPEICTIASRLKMDEDMVVGKLVRFWSWVAQNRVNGNDLGVTMDFVDRLVNRKGFATALCQAGWLRDDDGSLSLPNFDRHNSVLARTRALTKQRVEKHRIVSGKPVTKRNIIVTPSIPQSESIDPAYEDVEESSEDESETTSGNGLSVTGAEGAVELISDEGVDQAEDIVSDSVSHDATDELVEVLSDKVDERTVEEQNPVFEDAGEADVEIDEAAQERNEELSINAIPTFDALDSESVVEKIMETPVEQPPEGESKVTPARRKDDLFDDQPLLF